MVLDFFTETIKLLGGFQQCIFFLSTAYSEIFYGHFPLSEDSPHSCCHRYFVNEEHKNEYDEQKAIFDSMQDDDNMGTITYCTCSVIDLLMQTDQLYASVAPQLAKMISKHFIAMF